MVYEALRGTNIIDTATIFSAKKALSKHIMSVSIKTHNVTFQKNITLPENHKSNFHTWFNWVLFRVKFTSPPDLPITLTSKGIKGK